MGRNSMKLPKQDTQGSAFGGYLGNGSDGYHLEGRQVVRNSVKFKGPKKHRLFFRRSLRKAIAEKNGPSLTGSPNQKPELAV